MANFIGNHATLPYYSANSPLNPTGAYNSGPYDSANSPLNPTGAYTSGPYGGADAIAAPAAIDTNKYAKGAQRKRMNMVPIILALLLPWAMFIIIFGTTSFSVKYSQPQLCYFIVGIGFISLVVAAFFAADTAKKRKEAYAAREPTWIIFAFLSCVLMWIAGLCAGEFNHASHMRAFYDMEGLNTYISVDPSAKHGVQVMDGGRVVFTENSRLDLDKAMAFRNIELYCVAPITTIPDGNTTKLAAYDFWAVGKGCCMESGVKAASFRCGAAANPRAHGGLRLMTDDDRPFYRLAVQQAEAKFGIKATYPLFYTWSADPIAETSRLAEDGLQFFYFGVATAFIVQLFLVLSSTISFSRLGHL